MYSLRFRINKPYILSSLVVNQRKTPSRDKIVTAESQRLAPIITLSMMNLLLVSENPAKIGPTIQSFRRSLKSIESRPSTKLLLDEARAFSGEVERQWEANRRRVTNELAVMLRVPLPRTEVNVFTTHPSLPTGYAIPRIRAICWGHREEFRNYHSVYLAHELLHFLIPYDAREIDHALIELITDNELRIRLNGSGRYFEYPGHRHLLPLEKKLLPFWRGYLKRGRGNIMTLLRECRKRI